MPDGVIRPADSYGPWAPALSDVERCARLRCMRALVHLICGPRGVALAEALRRAEVEAEALAASVDELARLTPVDRRRVLASYAALHRSR